MQLQVLSLTMKPFKEHAADMKRTHPDKLATMYKYIMAQRNMDRIINHLTETFQEAKDIEAALNLKT